MKDKFLFPAILISIGMILTVVFAYTSEEVICYFAVIAELFAILKLIDK